MSKEPVFIKPPNTLLRIDELWAFISSDENGEGVCGMPMGNNWTVAMIAADQARVDSLMPVAKMIAERTSTKIKLVKFSTREEITEINPL